MIGGNNTRVNLDCTTFKGDDKDKFQFKHWFSQFESVIKANPSWSDVKKMNYLKTIIFFLKNFYFLTFLVLFISLNFFFEPYCHQEIHEKSTVEL